jgi:hypothetical protein
MRAVILAVAVFFSAGPALANARITLLMDVLRIREVVDILHAEGITYGEELNANMLGGQGGAFWSGQIRQIYDRERISERLRQALETGLSPQDVEAALAFYGSETGARIVALENAARRAMADPEVERAARDIFTSLAGSDDPLLHLVSRFIKENDLLERNVSGAMTSNYQFFKGLSDGRYLIQSDEDILGEVWSQQEDIRDDTEAWLNGYLLMAYEPLPLEVMTAYVDFAASEEGQSLNAALFEGFDAIYGDISYALGRAVSLNASGDET